MRAKRGGEHTGPNPTDRGKAGSTYHLFVDRRSVPLAVQLSAANVHDSKLLEPLADAVEPIRRPTSARGRPRKRPVKLHADKGYDYPHLRRAPISPPITPMAALDGAAIGPYRRPIRSPCAPPPTTPARVAVARSQPIPAA